MGRRKTDRTAELNYVAQALARHYGRFAEPVADVDQWLSAHAGRRVGTLLVVWDRADAAVVEHVRPEVEVRVAASLLNWARRRAQDAADPDDIPGQGRNAP